MIRYTPSHEWIRIEGKKGTVGITNHAQKELGDIVHVELPKLHRHLLMGHETCVLESTKAAADVYAPVAGTITAINEHLKADASLVNKHPESTGYLFEMEIADPKEIDYLLTLEQYRELISS